MSDFGRWRGPAPIFYGESNPNRLSRPGEKRVRLLALSQAAWGNPRQKAADSGRMPRMMRNARPAEGPWSGAGGPRRAPGGGGLPIRRHRAAGGGRIGENAMARLAGIWWREWPILVGGNGCFCSGASNGVRIARDRVALMARGDERSLLSRIAPLPRLWRLLHKDGRQGPVGNDCATWGNADDSAESARAPE